jgi:nucleotide-binding universal stress UspA family protein
MLPAKFILHPTDFSEAAINAQALAVRLAKELGSELVLIHCYDQPMSYAPMIGGLPPLWDTEVEKQLRTDLENRLEQMAADAAETIGRPVTYRLITNRPVWRAYEELNPDASAILVMGTTGHTGALHGGILGTNAERTIRYSPFPVLSVPNGSGLPADVQRIVFITDFMDDPRTPFLQLWPIARALTAEVVVVTISTPSDFFTDEYREEGFKKLKEDFPSAEVRCVGINANTFLDGAKQAAIRFDADLVSMYTHGRKSFFHLFQPDSRTEEVSANLKTPLLALKPKGQFKRD